MYKQLVKLSKQLYSIPRFWDRFMVRVKDNEKPAEAFQRETYEILAEIPTDYLRQFQLYLEKRSMLHIKNNLDFLNNDKTLINRSRLFEALSQKQEIDLFITTKRQAKEVVIDED